MSSEAGIITNQKCRKRERNNKKIYEKRKKNKRKKGIRERNNRKEMEKGKKRKGQKEKYSGVE